MQNMFIWACIITLENVTKQWCTGSNKIMQFMSRFTQPELKTPSSPHCKADTIHLLQMPFSRQKNINLYWIKPSTNIQLPYSPNQAPIETWFLPKSSHNVSVQSMARNSIVLWEYPNVRYTVHNIQKCTLDTSTKMTYCKVMLSILEFFQLQ